MTLKEFKKSIIEGEFYAAYHQFKNSKKTTFLGVREVDHVNSVGFGFISEKGASYCRWPKKSELEIIENGFVINNEICKLTYIKDEVLK